MPKPNRYKNMFKSTPESSPQVDSPPSTLVDLTPIGSTSIAPTNSQSSDARIPQPPKKSNYGRENNHHWVVDGINEYGDTCRLQLNVKDVDDMNDNMCIVVNFDGCAPIGEVAGLLTGVCGIMAVDCLVFLISFENWSDMPTDFFDRKWTSTFTTRFDFKVENQDVAKTYVWESIEKKWKEHRLKLWNKAYDARLTKNQIISNVPEGIAEDQWAIFVNYRLKPSTMLLCKRNQENRKKKNIPHTSGAKSLARRRAELKKEIGKDDGRGKLWKIIHSKKDGSYINEETREIAEKIDEHISQSSEDPSIVSPNDAIGTIFGEEHPGRVRVLGMGAVPTPTFKRKITRTSGRRMDSSGGSSSASASSQELQQKLERMESAFQSLVGYIAKKEGGNIPTELAEILSNIGLQTPDLGSGTPSPNVIRRSSDGSTNEDNDRLNTHT